MKTTSIHSPELTPSIRSKSFQIEAETSTRPIKKKSKKDVKSHVLDAKTKDDLENIPTTKHKHWLIIFCKSSTTKTKTWTGTMH